MEKGISTAIIVVIALVAVGAIIISLQPQIKISQPISSVEPPSEIQSEVLQLGTLCTGEENCKEFCSNNRGRCENYCKGSQNKLCKIIFPDGQESETQTPIQPPPPTTTVQQPSCISNPAPVFTHRFTDSSLINHVTPIGGINVGTSSRSYIAVKEYTNGTRMWVPVYAPVDATITRLAYAIRGDPQTGRAEYRLDIEPSCEVRFAFDHIAEIEEKFKKFAPQTPSTRTSEPAYVNIPVKAGELLGHTNGGLFGGAWDFILFNTEKKAYHINPTRWTSEHNINADCPYDYFTPELKAEYYSLFPSAGGERADNATCRSTSRDIAGTLSGGWFIGNSTDMKGSRLLVGSDYSIVDLIIDRDNQPRFRTRDYNPSKKPEDVRPGDVLCYSGDGTYAYIKLVSDNEMHAVAGSGTCPSSFPETGYETYNR